MTSFCEQPHGAVVLHANISACTEYTSRKINTTSNMMLGSRTMMLDFYFVAVCPDEDIRRVYIYFDNKTRR
jgi:hypothetical protein